MIGYALATAFAAPVDDGMMFADAARPARQSPFIEPLTVSCDAVAAWTVVIRPCLIPHLSFTVFTSGARPLVVHDAHETTAIDESYSSWLTPTTSVGVSASFAGAEMITFLAPPSMCAMQPSVVVKAPVDSHTYSTPVCVHGISAGTRVAESVTFAPLMMSASPSTSHVPEKRPWTVSCSRRNDSRSIAMRTTWRPMRPKPFTPSLIGASAFDDIIIGEARPSDWEASESMILACGS